MQRIRILLSLRLPQNIYFSYALKGIRTAVLSELKVPYSCSPFSILPSGHALFRASCSSFTSSDASDRDQFDYQAKQKLMETDNQGQPCQKWKKKAYGGIQPGYPDNHTDSTFLQEMITNANVVKRDLSKAILDSISISQYVSIVSLVVSIWTHTLNSKIDEHSLLKLDICLLALGFSVLLVTAPSFSLQLLIKYFLNISFFTSGLYVLAPVYHTLTRSMSSDSILALTVSLLVIHLFLHDYSGSTIRPPGALNNPKLASNISLNASIVASVLIASRLPSRLHVFAIMLFSLQVFLFAPLVMFCVKKYSFRVHLGFSFVLVGVTLAITYQLHRLFFGTLLVLIVFISVICPYWLIRIQEYKFEINGPWDEAKLCFDISE